MKAVQDVNHAFDLDCLSNKKQSTIKGFANFVSTLIKRKTRRKKELVVS